LKIWVDADACPKAIKEILYRVAQRRQIELVLVANQPLTVPRSAHIRSVTVARGFDVADQAITGWAQPGDLVITADIPLAADVVRRGGRALNPRGELYTENNVGEHLAVRNLMQALRGGGENVGGPAAFNATDRHAFANQLDRLLNARGPS
jgi:uncharacterized protein